MANLHAKLRSLFFIAILVAGAKVSATGDELRTTPFADSSGPEPTASVVVQGVKDPQRIAYRVMSAGLDAFDEYHQLAPAATLQFRLQKRGYANSLDSNWNGVRLRLVTDTDFKTLNLTPEGTFVLPRDTAAYENDAELRLNLKRSQVTAEPYVRTPGLPANVRRIGDLRLECQVALAIMKQELSVIKRAPLNTLTLGGNLCTFRGLQIPRRAPDRILSATLATGTTRKPIAFHGNVYEPPTQDKSIPDNALIEFQYWSRATLAQKQDFYTKQTLFLRGTMNNWQADDAFVARGDGRYSAVLTLSTGRHEFKVMSKAEGQIDLGAAVVNTDIALSKNLPLVWGGKKIALVTPGVASFEMTLNLQDPERPALEFKKLN